MQFYITNFANMRYLNDTCIPISTCLHDPLFFHNNSRNKNLCFVDSKNIMNGIRDELLSPKFINQENQICSKLCNYKPPSCPFLTEYAKYLLTIDFDLLMTEFNRTAEEVRLVTGYIGEPKIVLLVYESESNLCSERFALQKLFESHGIILKNLNKETYLC